MKFKLDATPLLCAAFATRCGAASKFKVRGVGQRERDSPLLKAPTIYWRAASRNLERMERFDAISHGVDSSV